MGSKLIFSNPLTLEPGRVTSVGYWIGIARRRGYYHETRFVPAGKPLVQGDLDFTKISSGYKVLVAPDGAGVVEAPAFKIRDPGFENFFILVFNSSGLEIELKRDSVSASTSGEYSRVDIKVIKDGLELTVTRFMVTRSKTTRLDIYTSGRIGDVTYYISDTALKVKLRKGSCKYRLLFEELIVVITHRDALSPGRLAKALKLKTPILHGIGRYRLRLILEIPFKEDVISETEINVIPKM